MSDLQPGDLILYNGESHVAMYVGDGYIVDAPHTGADVERIPESTSWYADSADGAVRPRRLVVRQRRRPWQASLPGPAA